MEYNVGNGCHSVMNVNLYKSLNPHFCTSSQPSADITVWHIWPWKCRSRSRSTVFAIISFNDQYQRLSCHIWVVFAWSRRFQDFSVSNFVILIMVTTYNILNAVFQLQKHDFLLDCNGKVSSIDQRFRDIYSLYKKKPTCLTLKMKVTIKEEKNETCAIQLKMFDSK